MNLRRLLLISKSACLKMEYSRQVQICPVSKDIKDKALTLILTLNRTIVKAVKSERKDQEAPYRAGSVTER